MFGIDTIYHIVVSMVILWITYFLLQDLFMAATVTMTIGILKELYDEFFKVGGYFDGYDIIADGVGVALAILVIKLIML